MTDSAPPRRRAALRLAAGRVLTTTALVVTAAALAPTALDAQQRAAARIAAPAMQTGPVVAADPTGDPGFPSAPAVAGQVVLGTLTTPVGFFGGGLATRWVARRLGAGDVTARRAAYAGAYTGAAVATATTVHFLGRTGRVEGSYLATVGGAALGEVASWGVVELGRALYRDGVCGVGCRLLGAAAFALPSIGATIAHGVTREYR